MNIPVFTFATFVTATPSAKLACVCGLQESQGTEYDPRIDWWKQLREFVPKNHREGGTKADLLRFTSRVTERKSDGYRARAEAYRDWWGPRNINWFGGSNVTWTSANVEVTVNPELFISVDGVRHVVKLYFKASERLTSDRVSIVLRLLELTYRGGSSPYGRPAVGVLDLAQSVYHEPGNSLTYLDPLLAGEAASFGAIWAAMS
jgi:hypothetical protein